MHAVRQIGPYLIGAAVWGSSLTLLVHGLYTGAWYGYVFAAIFVTFGLYLYFTLRRIQREVDAEMLELVMETESDSEPPNQA